MYGLLAYKRVGLLRSPPKEQEVQQLTEDLRMRPVVKDDFMIQVSRLPDEKRAGFFNVTKMPGVFCDVEGTLIDESGKVDKAVFEKLTELDQRGFFIRVWTSLPPDSLRPIRQMLSAQGLTWPVLCKSNFQGSIPEIVIDDRDDNYFREELRISPQNFVLVENLREIEKTISRVQEQRSQALEQRVRGYINGSDERIAHDSMNNIMGNVSVFLSEPGEWPKITPALTYERYIREYMAEGWPGPWADRVMELSNTERVAQYDDLVRRINLEISTGVTTETQVKNIRALIHEADKIIYGK